MTLILISSSINIVLTLSTLSDRSMDNSNWNNTLGGSSNSGRLMQSIPSSYINLSQADSNAYSWQRLITSASRIQLIQQQVPHIQYFQVQKPSRTQYCTQSQIFHSNKQFTNHQYVQHYNISAAAGPASIAPDRLHYQHHLSSNQLCQSRYQILQKSHMVNQTELPLTTCLTLSNNSVEGLNTFETPTPAYDQVSLPPLTPTFHEIPPNGLVNPLDAVPDILKDSRPGSFSFRSTSTSFVISQANFSYHSLNKKRKKNHRLQNNQVFIELNNLMVNSRVSSLSSHQVHLSNQKTYADVVQRIKSRDNNYKKMNKIAGSRQHMEQEDLEDESESTLSHVSSTTNETMEFSSTDSGKSTWQLTSSSSSSSHHGDDEEPEAINVKKSKLHRRQRISKMAQNFCFGELEKNVGFFWLWDQYSKHRRRLSYTEQLQENQQIENTREQSYTQSNGSENFNYTMELQRKDENSNVSHKINENTENHTYFWRSSDKHLYENHYQKNI